MSAVSAVELAQRERYATGLRLANGTAAMFVAYWLEAGVVVQLVPGRFALTPKVSGSRPLIESGPRSGRREARRLAACA